MAFGDTMGVDAVTGEPVVIARPTDLAETARQQTAEYLNNIFQRTGDDTLSPDDITVIWVSPSLERWRALCDSPLTDDYYEFTYQLQDGSSAFRVFSPTAQASMTQIEVPE